jgi:hypothetical protein
MGISFLIKKLSPYEVLTEKIMFINQGTGIYKKNEGKNVINKTQNPKTTCSNKIMQKSHKHTANS